MNSSIFTLILVLLLTSCGGGTNNSATGSPKKTTPPKEPAPVDYWQGVNFKNLPTNPEQLQDTGRSLGFTDGVDVTAEFDGDNGNLTALCRAEAKEGTSHRICLQKNAQDAWEITCGKNEEDLSSDCAETSKALASQPLQENQQFCTQGNDIEGAPSLICLDGTGAVAFEGDAKGYAAKRICRIHKLEGTSLSGKCFDGLKEKDAEAGSFEPITGNFQTTTWAGYQQASESFPPVPGGVVLIEYKAGELLKDSLSSPLELANLPPNGKKAFSLEESANCTINDPALGGLTGTAVGECTVVLVTSAEGFVDKKFTRIISIKEEQAATWEGIPGIIFGEVLGESLTPASLSGTTSSPSKTFTTKNESICRVNGGVIETLQVGGCTISLVVEETDKMTKTFQALVSIYDSSLQDSLNMPPVWPTEPYGASPTLTFGGSDLSLVAAPTGGGGQGGLIYRSTDTGVCTARANGTVSPIGVGPCIIEARWAGNAQTPASRWVQASTIEIQGTPQDPVAGFGYSSLSPKLSDTAPSLTEPTAPQSALFTYSTTADASICTVTISGVVTLKGVGSCPVTVLASRAGYTPVRETVTIEIAAGDFASLTWASFPPSSPKVGVETSAIGNPVSNPVADQYTITKSSGDCSWDNNTRKMSFSGITECVLTVTASKTGYTNKEQTFRITPAKGDFASITWPSFPATVLAGTSTQALQDPVSSPAADNISITKDSGACTWNSGTKILTFPNDNNTPCVMGVTVSKAGYNNKKESFTLTAGFSPINVATWGDYSATTVGGSAASAPSLTGLNPSTGITKLYESLTTSICTVSNGATGVVAGVDGGTCQVRLTLSKTNHNDLSHTYSFQVNPGIFTSLVWTAFPASAKVGTPTAALNPPVSVPAAGQYSIVKSSGSCTWDNTNAILSFEGLTECVLTVTATKTGYTQKQATFRVTPTAGTLSITWPVFPTSVTVGTTTPTLQIPQISPSPDTYEISKVSGGCTWNNNDRTLAFTDTSACVIAVRAEKVNFTTRTQNFQVTPAPATFSSVNWSDFPSSATVGTTTSALGDPVSVPAAGNYAIAKQSGDCTWNQQAKTISFTGTTACVMRVTATKTGYTTKSRDFSVTPGYLQMTVTNWGTYAAVKVGYAPVEAPDLTGPNPTDAAKAYTSTTTSICTVGETGTVTALAPGDCTIRLSLSKSGYNDSSHDYTFTVTMDLVGFKRDRLFKGLYLGTKMRPTLADVDGDGDKDIVVGFSNQQLRYFEKDANGYTEKTGEAANPFHGISGFHFVPAFTDVNGDGKLDLVIGDGRGDLHYYQKNSTGIKYTKKTGNANPFGSIDVGRFIMPTFVNLTGDAKLDLVLGTEAGDFYYFEKDSTGNSYTPKTGTQNPLNGINEGRYSRPEFFDWNGDGRLDLMLGRNNNIPLYYQKDASGTGYTKKTGSSNPLNPLGFRPYASVFFADINNDGNTDAISGGDSGSLYYYEKTDTGLVLKTESVNPFSYNITTNPIPIFNDVNGDNRIDLVVLDHVDGDLIYTQNDPDGYFEETGDDDPFSDIATDEEYYLAFANITGDARDDLIIGNNDGALLYYERGDNPDYTAKTGENNPFKNISLTDTSYIVPAFVNTDGDSDLELVVAGEVKSVTDPQTNQEIPVGMRFYDKNQNGFYVEKTGNDNPFRDIWGNVPIFGDVNGDGKKDLVVIRGNEIFTVADAEGAFYFQKDSTGSGYTQKTGENNPFRHLKGVEFLAFSDLNGDGELDILVALESNSVLQVALKYFDTFFLFD